MTKKTSKRKFGPNHKFRPAQQPASTDEVYDVSSPDEALDEFGQAPHPDMVVTPIKLFDWNSDFQAQKFANDGGISLLRVPSNINMKGKKRGKEGLLIYAEDRATLLIFMAWIKADDRCLSGSGNTGINRWRLLVGGKAAKKAQTYLNTA